jgi:hypothetical protein
LAREATDLHRRSMVDGTDSCIEAAHASESRRDGDLRHWQAGFVDEPLRKMQAPGLG